MRRLLLLAIFATLALAAPAGAGNHYLPQGISIPASGNANPFPSDQDVYGEPGLVTDVNVTLHQVSHENPDDLDISIQAPSGTTVGLMSDRCGTQDVQNRTWTFDDDAFGQMTDGGPCDVNSSFRPSDIDVDPTWPTPSSTPDGYDLTLFEGENPNGDWDLYVVDDANSNAGQITAGYTISLTVGGSEIQIPGGANSTGVASRYPATTTVSAGGIVTDVDVLLDGMTHSYPDDLEMLLEGPRGQKVRLISDACNAPDVVDFDWDVDDEAPASFSDDDACPAGAYRPANHEDTGPDETDVFPAPAPGGPYADSLAAFDNTDPDGDWKLWAFDDIEDDAGFLIGGYDLQIQTRPGAAVDLGPDVAGPEGGAAQLVVTRAAGDPSTAGTVRLRTADGTATSGSDYTPVDQVLSFAPGETSKTVEVPIAADGGGEPGQAFTASLSDSDGDASIGARSTATVAIPPDPVPLPPPPPPGVTPFSAANAASMPGTRRCKRRRSRLRFRAKAPAGITLARTELFVNGRRVANRRGARADDVIRVRVRKRRTRVRMRITATDGRVVTVKRTYRRCKPRRRRG